MRLFIRAVGLALARTLGAQVRDHESGRVLGRAFVIPWRGKIHVIGLEKAVRPFFRPQQRLTYWKQEIVFAVHPPPDFPSLRKPADEKTQETRPGPAAEPGTL